VTVFFCSSRVVSFVLFRDLASLHLQRYLVRTRGLCQFGQVNEEADSGLMRLIGSDGIQDELSSGSDCSIMVHGRLLRFLGYFRFFAREISVCGRPVLPDADDGTMVDSLMMMQIIDRALHDLNEIDGSSGEAQVT
jgi:hypothetical protein